jgi:transcriptional regulator with XRE-family HTH domain
MPPQRADHLARRFGANLKSIRVQRGLSQADLAYRAKLDQTAISRLELGLREPRLSTVVALANALDVKSAELIPGVK